MAKYLILYSAPITAKDLMAHSTPEQMEAGMEAWSKWKDDNADRFDMEWGMPLQATDHVTAGGVTPSQLEVSGYAIIEGESKDEIVKQLGRHPHLERQAGAAIDVLEMVPMPGM